MRSSQSGDRIECSTSLKALGRAPSPGEEERLYLAGCAIEVELDEDGEPMPGPKWYCPEDDLFYR